MFNQITKKCIKSTLEIEEWFSVKPISNGDAQPALI